jgi:hypothetical protein
MVIMMMTLDDMEDYMRHPTRVARTNLKLALSRWAPLSSVAKEELKELTEKHALSIAAGDLLMLESRWYVTHSGLLGLASRNRCSAIRTEPAREFCDAASSRWVFKATVYKTPRSKGFVGYGDADPSNVSSLVHGAEMRMAETRAVNRALRKAYGIGLCSVEEIGARSFSPKATSPAPKVSSPMNGNGQPSLRDRLCQLIRQYKLDPIQVKHYAAEFCGTENLRDAGKEKVGAFVANLAEQAAQDRDSLVSRLSSYPQSPEARS